MDLHELVTQELLQLSGKERINTGLAVFYREFATMRKLGEEWSADRTDDRATLMKGSRLVAEVRVQKVTFEDKPLPSLLRLNIHPFDEMEKVESRLIVSASEVPSELGRLSVKLRHWVIG